MVETINKLIRTSRHLLQKNGREPTSEEIAEEMEIPVEKSNGNTKNSTRSCIFRNTYRREKMTAT